ncbi:TrgA family protein [Cognatiyoonia sp. IB215446]|uniref:TrgA family protein n=1 Tax=Cognatiyoonia sp. IB215446 TaxID=3097355 RepID=UPI002A0E5BC1|nr:TrgA family protein [Cognatiyoonia sp. IB215446]MDX8348881.1 TrgA family protein [Cognatiyoonia sp. IB215446]
MPTAGRLAGAVIFALFGWYIGGIMAPFFPEERPPAYLLPMCAAFGLFIGWTVCGSRTGKGYVNAVSNGLTTIGAFSFCVVFALGGNQMISNALRNRYDGPMDALVGMFELMIEHAVQFLDVTFLATLIFGGIICALVAEYFGKKYP